MDNQPTASSIRSAKSKAVGGGRKRCRKGKACSATCISANKDCLVEMPESVGIATTKVVSMLKQKIAGNTSQNRAPSLETLSKAISQAKEDYEDAYGTANQASAKAKFDEAVENYQKAKAASTGTALTPPQQPSRGLTLDQNERIESATAATDRRIEKRLNDRQFYDDETNAKIKAQNQAVVGPFQKMTPDEKGALALYGQDGVQYYKQVNQLLRSGQMEESTPEKVKMAEFISQNLRSGLERLPAAQVEQLQRAVSGGFAENFGSLKVGDVIEDKGFGSYTDKGATTLNQFIKQGQPNAIIQVLNPKTAREVAPVMEYNSEGEHLTLPGTRYRLVSVNEEGMFSRKTGGHIPQYTFEEIQ